MSLIYVSPFVQEFVMKNLWEHWGEKKLRKQGTAFWEINLKSLMEIPRDNRLLKHESCSNVHCLINGW